MKFSDGYWDTKPEYSVMPAGEVYEYRANPDSLTLFAPCKKVRGRGDTLNIAQLTLKISSPLENVIRVEIAHFMGTPRPEPRFHLKRAGSIPIEVDRLDGAVSVRSGELKAVVATERGKWNIGYFLGDEKITESGEKQLAYVKGADGRAYMREQLSLGVGECVYGLGERFTPFVKNGQVVDMWNEDGGTSSELAYKNVPFYLTNRGYGVFVAHTEKVSFEVASEVVTRTQFSVPGEYLEYYIIGGGSPKETLRLYTELTGRPATPPPWSFGLWLTTSFTTSYDEKTVTGFVEGMAERSIPLHVFHFDCFWMKEFELCGLEWDRSCFPDPEGFLKRLKDRGLKICVWINSYVAQKSEMFAEGAEKGYLVKKADGGVWQWDRWQSGMGLVDFTNPEARTWFKDRLRRLIRMGVDTFKTDFGERIPTNVVYWDGSDPIAMHNYYTYLYNRTVFEVLKEEYGEGKALVFARSATAGGQEFPVHWGGDSTASYDSMAESLRGGLSLGLSGFGFWSHDIAGFERTATPDLYKRWVAFGLLSSHSRLHGSESYRVPWLFDDEASEVLRSFVELKCSLMPYVFAAAKEASESGLPIMRAMVLEYPDDPGCAHLDTQYMFGPSLLVAPIFNDKGRASYYCPPGRWTNFITGETVEGGRWLTEDHDYFSLPLMAKPCSVIPVGADHSRPDYDYEQGVVFHCFEIDDGAAATCVVRSQAGAVALDAEVRRDGSTLRATVSGEGSWSLCLRGIDKVAAVSGGVARNGKQGCLIVPDSGVSAVTMRL